MAAALVLTLLFPGPSAADHCPPGTPAEHEASDRGVPSFDETRIAVTVFRPADACAEAPVPVLLHGHGWAGSRYATVGERVRVFLDAGYGMVSIDARGHGGSGGQATVMHPDAEVRDYRAVLDWIAEELEWVAREGGDVVAGAVGASYGGAFQLMTAAFDERLDAIVPHNTWNDLDRSLAPNGVAKSAWISVLYAGGVQGVDMDPRVGEWFADTAEAGRPPPQAREHFGEASPARWMDGIETPALMLHGMQDTLFGVSEAAANYRGIRGNGADARLVGYHGGHRLPGAPELPPGDDVCGERLGLTLTFLDAHLTDDRDARRELAGTPRVAIPTEQGVCIERDDWPPHDETVTADLGIVDVPAEDGSRLRILDADSRERTVVGIPTITGRAAVAEPGVVYATLLVDGANGRRVVNDQATPVVVPQAGEELDVDLEAVATTLAPGERLLLALEATHERFGRRTQLPPAGPLLEDATARIPLLEREPEQVEASPLLGLLVMSVAVAAVVAVLLWRRR